MKKFTVGIIYFMSVIISAVTVLSSADLVMNIASAQTAFTVTAPKAEKKTLLDEETEKTEEPNKNTSSSTKETQENTSSATSSAVKTSASAVAKGKVIKQTIPYNSGGDGSGGVYIRDLTNTGIDIGEIMKVTPAVKMKFTSTPEVLVIHTHATESFLSEDRDYYTASDPTRSADNRKNMIAIGNTVCERLEAAGIKTLHITDQFDNPNYTGSYSRAASVIYSSLKKYPTIKVILDVHRDSISSGNDKVKTVATVNGKTAAQVMLVMGSETGEVTSFPNWKKNLSLAARFQKNICNIEKNLARPIMVSSARYNEGITAGSMLLEVGTEVNTFEEANYSAYLAGDALAKTLKELK